MILQVFGRHTGGERTYNSSSGDGSVALIGREVSSLSAKTCYIEGTRHGSRQDVKSPSRDVWINIKIECCRRIRISKNKNLRDVLPALEDVLLSHHIT